MNMKMEISLKIDDDSGIEVKEDKISILKLVRVNPNGKYGTFVFNAGLTREQREEIEKILNITLDDYKFDV